MLFGRIRPVEVREITVEADGIDAARAQVDAQVPPGWALTDAAATMAKASVLIILRAKMARRDGVDDIQAADMAALRSQVPEGWQLVSVREA
nr:hypothetical protein [Microbacterium bovistercoris]